MCGKTAKDKKVLKSNSTTTVEAPVAQPVKRTLPSDNPDYSFSICRQEYQDKETGETKEFFTMVKLGAESKEVVHRLESGILYKNHGYKNGNGNMIHFYKRVQSDVLVDED